MLSGSAQKSGFQGTVVSPLLGTRDNAGFHMANDLIGVTEFFNVCQNKVGFPLLAEDAGQHLISLV